MDLLGQACLVFLDWGFLPYSLPESLSPRTVSHSDSSSVSDSCFVLRPRVFLLAAGAGGLDLTGLEGLLAPPPPRRRGGGTALPAWTRRVRSLARCWTIAPSDTFWPMVSATLPHGILMELVLHTDWMVSRSCSLRLSAAVSQALWTTPFRALTVPSYKRTLRGPSPLPDIAHCCLEFDKCGVWIDEACSRCE